MELETKTIIIENNRCAWGKCIFCSFSKKRDIPVLGENRLNQLIENELKGITTLKQLKFFNSGSFLDANQIPVFVQDFVLKKCKELKTEELIFECHPMFITDKNIERIRKTLDSLNYNPKISVAIGLETADDRMLKKIKKGITLQSFEKAVGLLKKYNFYARTYLMANLPYEKDVEKSLDRSVDFALKHSEKICIINTYPYGYAELFDIWLSRKWHPLNKKDFENLTGKYKKNKKIEIYFDDFISYPKFSIAKQKKVDLYGANKFNLTHPYYEVWQEYLADFYLPPKIKNCILFLPCSFRKPYSMSKTHKAILERLKSVFGYEKIHQIMISNPGLIPREFESKYPFANYDWSEAQETPAIKKLYTKVTQERIEKYLENHRAHYAYTSKKPVFCYLKYESESYIALENACKKQNIALVNLLDKEAYDFLKKEGMRSILTNQILLDKMFLHIAKAKI
ncbi:MAG: hypothetical protein DRN66_03305 [Candidatus Nanohalarchaeota archaeon]|nr:MAG: hypothetical protein DRN66_03305 [Candidatus Nanohaloarchaeota archaeon]